MRGARQDGHPARRSLGKSLMLSYQRFWPASNLAIEAILEREDARWLPAGVADFRRALSRRHLADALTNLCACVPDRRPRPVAMGSHQPRALRASARVGPVLRGALPRIPMSRSAATASASSRRAAWATTSRRNRRRCWIARTDGERCLAPRRGWCGTSATGTTRRCCSIWASRPIRGAPTTGTISSCGGPAACSGCPSLARASTPDVSAASSFAAPARRAIEPGLPAAESVT